MGGSLVNWDLWSSWLSVLKRCNNDVEDFGTSDKVVTNGRLDHSEIKANGSVMVALKHPTKQ